MANLLNGLGGVAGFGENSLTRNDDSFTSGLSLTSVFGAGGLNFFGTNYTAFSVNNNGNITFGGSGFSGYTPFGLQNGTVPIIAAFFADVDTRGSSSSAPIVPNTVTPTPGGTSQGSNITYFDLDPTGFGRLTVTWDDVGYYSSRTDKLNAFQLQLVGTGGGNFDVYFRYEAINWTTGNASGGSGGLGGTVARAGYSTGNGSSWYELAQSGIQDQMLALETTAGNTGVAGFYKFSVRSGTAASETIVGTAFDDVLAGAGGNDLIYGLAGNDTLDGNSGADRMYGGLGNDKYVVDNTGDIVIELAGQGTDTVQSSISYTLGSNVENLLLTGTAAINGIGNTLGNVLTGNSGNNILNGLGGVDTVSYATYGGSGGLTVNLSLVVAQSIVGLDTLLNIENVIGTINGDTLRGSGVANVIDGNLGADDMFGGLGNDTYYVDNSSDTVTETSALATEIDTVRSTVTYTLGANQENLVLLGSAASNGDGNTLNNSIIGNSAANFLSGGAGNDVLYGGAGADDMVGGLGNDTYYVDNGADVTTETSALSTEIDTVRSTVGRTLGANLENLTLFGSAVANGFGNALNNVITGNSAANTLVGGLGNDTLAGGLGNDTYYVDSSLDVTTETSALATEIDTVRSTVSRSLGANLENLVLSGSAVSGVGNSLNNVITGNSAANYLSGSSGNDTLIGGAGNDLLIGGLGRDILTGGTGSDRFDFNTLAESVAGVNRDVITDFVHGVDKIDLSTIDAIPSTATNNAFTYIGGFGFTTAGQVRFSGGILSGNTDANLATSEFQIQLTGVATLSSTDFFL